MDSHEGLFMLDVGIGSWIGRFGVVWWIRIWKNDFSLEM